MVGSTACLGQPSPGWVTAPPGKSYSILTTEEQEFGWGCHGVSAPTAPHTSQGAQSPEGNKLRAGLDSQRRVDIPVSSTGCVRNTE